MGEIFIAIFFCEIRSFKKLAYGFLSLSFKEVPLQFSEEKNNPNYLEY